MLLNISQISTNEIRIPTGLQTRILASEAHSVANVCSCALCNCHLEPGSPRR